MSFSKESLPAGHHCPINAHFPLRAPGGNASALLIVHSNAKRHASARLTFGDWQQPQAADDSMTHQEFSSRGGKAGTGDAKRRSPEHYKRLARLGVAGRLRAFAFAHGRGSLTRAAVRGKL